MLENQLIQVFRPLLLAGLSAQGFNDVQLIKQNQPTQQGRANGRVIYFSQISDKPYGFQQRDDYAEEGEPLMVHEEKQSYETTFQFTTYAEQDPADINSVTAADLAKLAALLLQNETALATYKAANIQILRISDITQLYIVNDQDEYEQQPSFNLTFKHELVTTSSSPVIIRTEFNSYQVP
jgi:hypothetical protein